MTETHDFQTDPSPKDRVVMVQFRDGAKTKARLGPQGWEVPYEGKWRPMKYAHGGSMPVVWWQPE